MSTLLTEFCFFSVNTVVLERKYEAHCIYSFICVLLLLFFFFLCLKLNTCLAFSPAYCSDVFLFPRPCGSMECATKEISEMTQNQCPRLSVCLNNTPILLRKLNTFLETHPVVRAQFYWCCGKAVAVIYKDSWLEELLTWNTQWGGGTRIRRMKKNILVVGEMKMCKLCTYAKSLCCWGQFQCAVCYGFAML